MGVFKLGSVIKYIPYPTATGFTGGIAVVLLSTQVKDFFGLRIEQVPAEFIEKWAVYLKHFNTVDIATTMVGIVSLFIILLWPKINKTVPGSLIAVIVVTLGVKLLGIPVDTIGSRFGEISSSIELVNFSNLNITFSAITELIRPAVTIAFLAGIESLLSAVVADGMIGKKHNSNMELIAQGVANIASALFGGIPATGAIARTAANVKNGGRTPIAGMVHTITLLLIMLVFMPLAKLIPMSTLAAILVVVAYNMSEWRSFKGIFSSTKSDVTVLLVTFALTVVFDLVIAIEIGIIIAMFLFVRRMSENKLLHSVSHELGFNNDDEDDEDTAISENDLQNHLDSRISVFKINGPLFFGVVNKFLDVLDELKATTKIIILNMKNANSMDATALNALKQLVKRCKSKRMLVLFTEANEQPMKILERSGFVENIGRDRFFSTTEEAIKVASEIITVDFNMSTRRRRATG